VLNIFPASLFSGIQRKFNFPPILFSGIKKKSGVLNNESPKIMSSFDEPRTVPPSPGHITQLGTSDVLKANEKVLI
jgi:hypothetical protein